jgi:DNA-binding NarL/FixJ family response regulator
MIRVFIYDDSDARKESLKTLLDFTDNMLFVGSASDCGNVAVDMSNATPDIVLMDVEMPLADGIEGVRQIKQAFPHVKVIMQTVYEDIDKIFKAFQHGAEGYILKKASISQITESIDKVYEGQVFITPSMALQVMNFFKESSSSGENKMTLLPVESEIIQLISLGYSNKIIGEKLSLQDKVINSHIKGVYKKLQLQK